MRPVQPPPATVLDDLAVKPHFGAREFRDGLRPTKAEKRASVERKPISFNLVGIMARMPGLPKSLSSFTYELAYF